MPKAWYIAEISRQGLKKYHSLTDLLKSVGFDVVPYNDNYFYIELDLHDNNMMERLKLIRGFKKLLPNTLNSDEVDSSEVLKSIVQKLEKPIKEGSKIVIVSVLFQGAEGTLEGYLGSSYERAKVSIDLRLKSIHMDIGIEYIATIK